MSGYTVTVTTLAGRLGAPPPTSPPPCPAGQMCAPSMTPTAWPFTDGTGADATFSRPANIAIDTAGNVIVADSGNNRIRKITPAGVVTTLAGNNNVVSADGTGTAASFLSPSGLAIDSAGNILFSSMDQKIRVITPAGLVTTLAGGAEGPQGTTGRYSADGTGSNARFYMPTAIVVNASGTAYLADPYNSLVRRITFPTGYTANSGVVSTFAGDLAAATAATITPVFFSTFGSAQSGGTITGTDGTGTSASFKYPFGLCIDSNGNIYVSDNQSIRKMTPNGVVSTVAGSGLTYIPLRGSFAEGTGLSASFSNPSGLAVDANNNIYVADTDNNRIRKITPGGTVTTIAGNGAYGYVDGPGSSASFGKPTGIAVNSAGTILYVSEAGNNCIRKITITPTTIVGSAMSSGSPAPGSPAPVPPAPGSSGSGSSATGINRGLMESIIYAQSEYNLERIRDDATSFIKDFTGNTDPTAIELVTGYTALKGDIEAYKTTMDSQKQIDIDLKIGDFSRRNDDLYTRKRKLVNANLSVLGAGAAAIHFWLIDVLLYWGAPLFSLAICFSTLRLSPTIGAQSGAFKLGNYLIFGFWSMIWYPITLILGFFYPPSQPGGSFIIKFLYRILSAFFLSLFIWAAVERNMM